MDGMSFVGLLAQAGTDAAEVAKTAESAVGTSGWQFFLIASIVFIVPFVIGHLIGLALRMKDVGGKLGLVLCAVFLASSPFIAQALNGKPLLDAIPQGIDLAGGTNLIYAIDREQAKADGKQIDSATLNKMIGAVTRRINPSGAEEVTVRRVGDDRIEVIIPGADREMVERKKRQIVDLGSLEFAILANDKDHRQQIEAARKLKLDQDNLVQGGRVVASWRNVAPGEDVFQLPNDRTATRQVDREIAGETTKVRQFLVIHEPPERVVTGRYLNRVYPQMDDRGQLAVSFTFNARGAQLFSNLTGRYVPDTTDGFERRLAVLLNGDVQTAPNLKSRISGSGQISGNFSRQEIDDLVNVLNAGALEVPLIRQPVSEFTVSPTLGVDVRTKGFTAILVSLLAVLVFMLVYYRVAGIIAVSCLVLNLILVVGTMAFIEATFTLPGLAGLVLTIGMAVDANVLIYERLREELQKGSSLRMSIENAYEKAFSTIVDSNVTSLMTAAILYLIGSDQIRGFAVTLFIGLVMSLFTVLYFARLCFHIIERKRLVRTFHMMQFFGETQFDFLATRRVALLGSTLFIATGFAALVYRGTSNFDIDFTGGSMVTFEFVDTQQTDQVKGRLVEQFGSTISLERLVLTGETSESAGGHRFRLRTTELDQDLVTEGISKAFAGDEMELVRVTVKAAAPTEIAAVESPSDDELSDRFAGGLQSSLTFNSPIAVDTAQGYLADAIRGLTGANGQPKYDAVSSLMTVVGVPTEGETVTEFSRFTNLTAKVTPDIAADDFIAALDRMSATLAGTPAFEEVNSFASSVAFETQLDALMAIAASLLAIVIYIWYRFEKVYFGLAAVVALAHDVLVTLGAIAIAALLSETPLGPLLLLEDFKINLALIASLLTIVGYSLNDTIVIFDRIREIKGKNPRITYEMINGAVNQTLSRTILTALTTAIVVVILYVFGGSGIHGFAFSMIIGSITGVYSTIYIANPVMYWLLKREMKLPQPAPKLPSGAAPAA